MVHYGQHVISEHEDPKNMVNIMLGEKHMSKVNIIGKTILTQKTMYFKDINNMSIAMKQGMMIS